MSIPDFQTCMRPLLELAREGEHHNRDAIRILSDKFELSADERNEMVPSGQKTRMGSNVTWAKTYLKKAGLLTYTGRGLFRISDKGKVFLTSHQGPIRIETLKEFDAFNSFIAPKETPDPVPEPLGPNDVQTPDERIRSLYETLNDELASELIERIQDLPPAFFERLLVNLLVTMGYGGSVDEAGRDLGRSGDGGVDGVIDQDRLGVDQVYIQAKRYADGNTVGSGAIRDFFGALNMKRAHKGIFFTTSSFTQSAHDTAAALSSRIVLINGKQLARLMIENNIGCREDSVLTLRRIDEDFFDVA